MISAALFVATLLLSSPNTAVADLSFLEGVWRGDDGEVMVEETWSSSQGGHHIGMFRMMRGDQIVFSELITIEPLETGIVMRLRHFGKGLEAKEDRDGALVFDLVESEVDRAVFSQRGEETRLVYERDGGALTIVLEKMIDGEWNRTEFSMERQ